jgi:hypothetical protein
VDSGERHVLYPEFYARGTSSVFGLRDCEGRLFGETNAPVSSRPDEVFDVRACPYPGTRDAKPMNVSALRQVTKHWADALACVAELRDAYVHHFGDRLDIWWLWRFGICASALPGFLVGTGTPAHEISGVIAGMFKVIQGIYMTGGVIVERGLHPPDTSITAARFVELTEHERVFVSPAGGACAGPPHMVLELVEAVITGGRAREHDRTLAVVSGRYEQLFAYGQAIFGQVLVWQILDAHCNRAMRALRDRCARATGAAAERASKLASARLRQFDDRDPAQLESYAAACAARLTVEGGGVLSAVRASPEQVEAVVALARKGGSTLAADHAVLDAWAETFLTYVLLEREALHVFNELQRRIDTATGQPPKPPLDGNHVAEAYFKNLRTMLRAALSITLVVEPHRLIASAAGSELTL